MARALLYLAALAVALSSSSASQAQALITYEITGDGITTSLTGQPGNAARGRALVASRASTCLLCHSGPMPEVRSQGDLAPNLAGSGSRWSSAQLRLRLVDAPRINPDTIMPAFYRVDGLIRVSRTFADLPVLTAEQIEDIVAYLVTLRE